MPSAYVGTLNPNDTQPGQRLIDGGTIKSMVQQSLTATTGVTALAGGGLSGSTPVVSTYITEVTTTASANDSIALPNAVQGLEYEIVNSGAQNLRVYCQTANQNNISATGAVLADTIIPLAGGTATYVTIPANAIGIFSAVRLGYWKSQNQ